MDYMNLEDVRKMKRYIQDKKTAKAEKAAGKVAQLCNWIGLIYAKYGKYKKAIKEHKEEKKQCDKADDKLGKVGTCRLIGENRCALGQFDKALKEYQESLALAEECHDALEKQRAWNAMGQMYLEQAENKHVRTSSEANKHAMEAFSEGLKISEQAENETSGSSSEHIAMKVRLLLNLGLVYDNTRNKSKRNDVMEEALNIAKKNKCNVELQMCYRNKATWLKSERDYWKAIQYYDMALEITQKSNNKTKEMELIISKAKCLAARQNFLDAKECLEQAESMEKEFPKNFKEVKKTVTKMREAENNLNTETTEKKICHLHETIADGQVKLGNFSEAIDHYFQVLHYDVLSQDWRAAIYVSLAETYSDLRYYNRAICYYKKELEIRKTSPKESCLTNLSIAQLEEWQGSDFPSLQAIFQEAYEQAERVESGQLMIRTLKEFIDVKRRFHPCKDLHDDEMKLNSLQQKYGEGENQRENARAKGKRDEGEEDSVDSETSGQSVSDEGDSSSNTKSTRKVRTRAKTLLTSSVDEEDYPFGSTSRKAKAHQIHSKCIKKRPKQSSYKKHSVKKMVSSDIESSGSEHSICLFSFQDLRNGVVEQTAQTSKEKDIHEENGQGEDMIMMESSDHCERQDVDPGSPIHLEKEANLPKKRIRSADSADLSDFSEPIEGNFSGVKKQRRGKDTALCVQALFGASTSCTTGNNRPKASTSSGSTLTPERSKVDRLIHFDTVIKSKEALRKVNVSSTNGRESVCWSGGNEMSGPGNQRESAVVYSNGETCSESEIGTLGSVHVQTTNQTASPDVKFVLKVEINGKKMIVPVFVGEESKSFIWFSERVAKRYFSLFFIYPEKLIFTTQDGYVISPSDPICILSKGLSELRAEVYSWSVQTTVNRYVQACRTLNEKPNPLLQSALENIEKYRVLDFSFCNIGNLDNNQLLPVWRSLRTDSRVTELCLNGNNLTDSTLIFLKKKLLTRFPSLTDLKLESNELSVKGFKSLASFVQNGREFDSLTSLSLSYNRLTDDAESALATLLESLPHLSNLSLAGCSFTSQMFTSNLLEKFSGCSLVRLNISENQLTKTCLQSLFTSLKKERLKELDISHCLPEESCNIYLDQLLHPISSHISCCLQTLSLAGCHLSVQDVCISNRFPIEIPTLQQFDVSSNSNVMNKSLQKLFYLSASERSQLKTYEAKECGVKSPLACNAVNEVLTALDTKLHSRVPLSTLIFTCEDMTQADKVSIQSLWERHWGNSAIVTISDRTVNLCVKY